jgi:hypothetical protein
MRTHFIIAVLAISFWSSVSFGADDFQFEGKSMDGWLNLLTGRPEKIYGPFPNDEM